MKMIDIDSEYLPLPYHFMSKAQAKRWGLKLPKKETEKAIKHAGRAMKREQDFILADEIASREVIGKIMKDLETNKPRKLNLIDMTAGEVASSYNDLLDYVLKLETVVAILVSSK